jgi:hypothetical protein
MASFASAAIMLCHDNWDFAIPLLTTAVAEMPDDFFAICNLAFALVKRAVATKSKQDWLDAAALYRRGVEIDPNSYDATVGLAGAVINISDDNWPIAIPLLETALASASNDYIANCLLASCLRCKAVVTKDRADLAAVEKAYRKAHESEPDSIEALLGLASAMLEKRDNRRAAVIGLCERAISSHPTNPRGYNLLGYALLQRANVIKSKQSLLFSKLAYLKGLSCTENPDREYYDLAYVSWKLRDTAGMIKYAEMILKLHPTHRGARIILQKALMRSLRFRDVWASASRHADALQAERGRPANAKALD